MRGRCVEYALTSLFTCSLFGMSLDCAAMAAKNHRCDLGQPEYASGAAWGSARHRSRTLARDYASRLAKAPDPGAAASGGLARRRDGSHRRVFYATRREGRSAHPRPHSSLSAVLRLPVSPSASPIARNLVRVSGSHVPPSARIDAVPSIPIGSSPPICMTLRT